MAGQGTISVNQQPVYGDKKKLEKASAGLTKTPTTGIPTPKPSAGRPVTTGEGVSQTGNAQPTGNTKQGGVPQEHSAMMEQYAQAFRTNQFWQGVVAQYPSEWSKMYAQEAADVFSKLQSQLRNSTPFFE